MNIGSSYEAHGPHCLDPSGEDSALLQHALIHPSAWKVHSEKMNFRFTEFSEVRVAPVRRFVPLCGVPGA
jgi:hypothetical protein